MSNEKVAELRNFIKNPRDVGFSAHPDILERREIKIPNESKQSTKEYGAIFPYWSEESKKHTGISFSFYKKNVLRNTRITIILEL